MSEAAVHGLAGAGGGIIAQLITYPLQTVNTRQQVLRKAKNKGKSRQPETGSSSTPDSDEALAVAQRPESFGSLQLMYQVLRDEGWGGLYKGLPPSLVGVAISQGVYYYFYQWLRSVAVQRALRKHPKGQAADGSVGTMASLVVAAVAGAINVLMTNPIWVIVTRMQTESTARQSQPATLSSPRQFNFSERDAAMKPGLASSSMVSELPTRAGMVKARRSQSAASVIAELFREAGILGFWKGVFPTLLMVINPAIQFMLYESLLARLLAKKKVAKANSREAMKKVTGSEVFVIGAIAKLGATVLTYPMLVVKSRLQAKQEIGVDASMQYTGTLDAILKMIQFEGLQGFYKGMSTKIVQSVLAAAILFMTKEELVKLAAAALERRKTIREAIKVKAPSVVAVATAAAAGGAAPPKCRI